MSPPAQPALSSSGNLRQRLRTFVGRQEWLRIIEQRLGDFRKRLSHVARMERSGIRGVPRGTWIPLRFIQAT